MQPTASQQQVLATIRHESHSHPSGMCPLAHLPLDAAADLRTLIAGGRVRTVAVARSYGAHERTYHYVVVASAPVPNPR